MKEHLAVLRMKKRIAQNILEGKELLRLLRHNSQDRALNRVTVRKRFA